MIKHRGKTTLVKGTMLAFVAGAVLAGCVGCGSKGSAEQEKKEAQVPQDAMQKEYQNRAGKPSQ